MERKRGRPQGHRSLDEKREEILRATIKTSYMKPNRPSVSQLVRDVQANCISVGLKPPHRRTIVARLEDIDLHKRAKKRGEEMILKATTPVPGSFEVERPLDVVQMDHTKADIFAAWVGRASFELTPVYDALLAHLKRSSKLFMDETTAPVLDPGRRKTKTGYFWALARDDRPWGGDDPPGVAFTYAPGRSGQYADEILKGFSGTLQVDGYAGYNRLLKHPGQDIRLAYCWAHARRKLHEISQTGTTPIADECLRQIAALYRIEKEIRGQSPEARLAARHERSKPLVDAFERWLTANRARVSPKAPLGQALKYIAKYWDGLTLFLDDGRIEIDSNAVERTIRPIALNRKNALFAGHEAGAKNWVMLASLIETCKLNSIDPHAWLTTTLTAIINGHKQADIDALLPWNYKGSEEGYGHEHNRIEGHA